MANEIIQIDSETIKEAINILKICKKALYLIGNNTFDKSEIVLVMLALDDLVSDLENTIKE